MAEKKDSLIYYRLIALWVLSEAMLGGIIHGFKLPISGLVVGSCAVVCICLIGWYAPVRGAIIKATLIVAIFKMMLSPQAPPPAYIAVFFQGLLGEILFHKRRLYAVSCMVLAVLALLESGLQRILMLTIIYGNDLWKVVNEFINTLTKQKKLTNYSLWIGAAYVFMHLAAGLFTGWWASILPKRIERWRDQEEQTGLISNIAIARFPVTSRRKKGFKKGLFVIWIILILLFLQSYFKIKSPILSSSNLALWILLRSVLIVLTWYFLLSPLLQKLIHRWLQRKKSESQSDVQRVIQLLPSTMQLVTQSWRLSSGKKRLSRLIDTGKRILVSALYSAEPKQVWILTGQLQSGKTTSLLNWTDDRKDVAGILTPVVNGRREFMNVKTREKFPMEASPGEGEVLSVGRFVFSKINFDTAAEIIRSGINKEQWLIIDEIGPMELRGEGFAGILKEVLQQQQTGQTLVLVVREGMVDKVKEYFGLDSATVIKKDSFREAW